MATPKTKPRSGTKPRTNGKAVHRPGLAEPPAPQAAITPLDPDALLAKCRPLGDRVVIEVEKAPNQVGSILLPDSSQTKPSVGRVIAIGAGKDHVCPLPEGVDLGLMPQSTDPRIVTVPIKLRVGDRVIFSRYAGQTLDTGVVSDGDYLLMREDDVLAVIPK